MKLRRAVKAKVWINDLNYVHATTNPYCACVGDCYIVPAAQ